MNFSSGLFDGVVLRPVRKMDARALTEAFQKNRTYLAPWEPIRPDRFYTVQGQQEVIARQRTELGAGTALPMVLAKKGNILGLLTLSSVVRGAFQNAHLGYWSTRPPKVRD
jgi:[ribosomal protein S5]-alanine N-acetyltransferase